MKEKKWSKPQLIILTRGAPEENVLTHCKFIGGGGGNGRPDSNNQDGCNDITVTNCHVCQARASGS